MVDAASRLPLSFLASNIASILCYAYALRMDVSITGLWAIIAMLGLGGLGGLGLTVRFCSFRLSSQDQAASFILWGPLFVAVTALALAHLGIFSILGMLVLSFLWGAMGLLGLWGSRNKSSDVPPATAGGRLFWAGWLAILMLAGVVSTPPSHYLGGWDTGVYVGASLEMGRSGTLEVHDDLLAELSPVDRKAFMHEGDPSRPAWHAGFLITDAETGRLIPEFYHLYPAWLAVWGALFGLAGVWVGHTVIALYALGMVMLAGAALFGRRAALLAGLALTACAAQAYAMKITCAEMITQFSLFGGIWALAQVLKKGHGSVGFMAALAFAWAAAVLAHGTALLPVGAGLVFLVVYALAGRREWWRWQMLGLVAAGTGLAMVWNGTRADAMTVFLMSLVFAHPGRWAGVAVLGGLLVVAGLRQAGGTRGGLLRACPSWLERWVPVVMASALLLFGYVVRPILYPGAEARNVDFFIQLTGWAGIVLALCFPGWRRVREWEAGPRALVFMGLITTLVLLVNKMAKPFYLWGSRRWMEFALPVVFLLASATIVRLAMRGSGKRRWAALALALLAAAAWLAEIAPRAGLVYRTREYAALPAAMSRAADHVRNGDNVLCDHWDTAAILRYVHAVPAWGLSRLGKRAGVRDARLAAGLMRRWAGEGKRVYWIGGWFADPDLRLTEAGLVEADMVLLEQRGDRLPNRAVPEKRRVRVFRVDLRPPGAEPDARFVDVGYSAMGLIGGFGGVERERDPATGSFIGYRRTRGLGRLYLPALPGRWRIRLNGGGAAAAGRPVTVKAGGSTVGQFTVGPRWETFEFGVPLGLGTNGVVELQIESPVEERGKQRLGVAVDWLSAGD